MTTTTLANIIAGTQSSESKKTFYAINPQTNQQSSYIVYEATTNEIDTALTAANQIFQKTRKYPIHRFSELLTHIAQLIHTQKQQLIQTAQWETALPKPRLENELHRTTMQLQKFSTFITHQYYQEPIIDVDTDTPSLDLRRYLIPIGPVVIFEASNFPYAFGVCGGDTASAIAAGCPIIVKAHPSHPKTAYHFAEIIKEALTHCRFPKSYFSLIYGIDHTLSEALVTHPYTKAVGFTGSLYAGRSLFEIASSRPTPIPVYAEMGSINPIFLTLQSCKKHQDTLPQQLAESISLGSGQFCTKPGIIILPDHPQAEKIIQKTAQILEQSKLHPLLNQTVTEKFVNCTKITQKIKGVKILLDNVINIESNVTTPLIMTTTAQIFLTEPQLHQEHFGPSAIFVVCKKFDEYIEIAQQFDGQLTATIHCESSDFDELKSLIQLLEQKVGRLIFNGVPTGVAVSLAMHHGGPYPASTTPFYTSVGMMAIKRFLKPICYQNFPQKLLPNILKNKNPEKIYRIYNGQYSNKNIVRTK